MRRLSFILLVVIVGLTACSGAVVVTQGVPPGPNNVPPSNPTPTRTLDPTFFPSSTIGPPIPESLTTAEIQARLNPFDPASSCILPCYIGMTPGQSGLQDALVFYARLGIGANDMVPGDYEQVQSGTGHLEAWLTRSSDILQALEQGIGPPQVDVFLQDGVVQYVYVVWPTPPEYLSPGIVLDEMGEPDGLSLGLSFATDPAIFIIQMAYSQQQAGFVYMGVTDGDDTARQVCFSPGAIRRTVLGSFAPSQSPMEGLGGSEVLLPLETSTGLTYEDFVATVKAGGCLMIPAELWPQWATLDSDS